MSSTKQPDTITEKMDFGTYLKKRRTEDTDLSQAKAAEMTGISLSRFEKIERGIAVADAYDVSQLAKAYKLPDLCNYYCANECPIGKAPDSTIPQNIEGELSQIVVSLLNSINKLDKQKERLLEISEDGKIDNNEYRDLYTIETSLQKISEITTSLSLWIKKQILDGKIDADDYQQIQKFFEK